MPELTNERVFTTVWSYPVIDVKKGWIDHGPMQCQEGEAILVQLISGEYVIDTVCFGNICDDDNSQEVWLKNTQDWSNVYRWARLPQ